MMFGRHGSDTTGSRHGARRPSRLLAVTVMAAVSLGAAACSSSGNSVTPTTAASTTTAVTFNPATEQTDVGTVYNTLFNLANPALDSKLAVIQNGSTISSALQDALSSTLATSSSGSKVSSVTVLSASGCSQAKLPSPCAKVIYDILGASGASVLAAQQGYAVFVDGHWLVAKSTICGLLGLFYSASGKTGSPKGC